MYRTIPRNIISRVLTQITPRLSLTSKICGRLTWRLLIIDRYAHRFAIVASIIQVIRPVVYFLYLVFNPASELYQLVILLCIIISRWHATLGSVGYDWAYFFVFSGLSLGFSDSESLLLFELPLLLHLLLFEHQFLFIKFILQSFLSVFFLFSF